jgi:hypothetical protein
LSVPWFDCDESLTCCGLNSNLGGFSGYTFFFVSCEETHLLISWCAGGRCGMTDSDKDHGRSRRADVEDRGWSHMPGTRWPDDREVGSCCVRSAPCIWRRGARVSWLSLKTKVDSLSVVWHQNNWDSFFRFCIKTGGDGFSRFGLTTGGEGFHGLGLKTGSFGLVIWVLKLP